MRKGVEFRVGVWSNIKASKTILDSKRNNVTFEGDNALKTTWNMNRLIIDIVLVPLKLTMGMNGCTFTK